MKFTFSRRNRVLAQCCLLGLCLSLMAFGAAPMANERWVAPNGDDSAKGSRDKPWRSLQHAAEKARPGMTIHVAPGSYTGPVVTTVSGTPGARIRFISDVKWGAAIRSHGADDVWTNRASDIDIAGFDIRGDGALGIANWGSRVRIVGNHVHDIPAAHCTGDGGAGIDNMNYDASDNDIIGNVVHDIGEGPGTCGRVHGIYHSNLGGHIFSNVVYRNAGYGIHLWHAAAGVVIANNTVVGNGGGTRSGCRGGGIVVGAGDRPGGRVNDETVVVNNLVADNGCVGIVEYCSPGENCTGSHNLYLNNLLYGNLNKQIVLRNGLQAQQTVSADPQLVSVQNGAVLDYHLRPGSPAIRHGTGLEAPAMDIDGASWPANAPRDIGASQYQATAARWPWF